MDSDDGMREQSGSDSQDSLKSNQRSNPGNLENRFDSNFRYVLVVAKRARQLQNGFPPLVASQSHKPCRVAQDEIAAGLVKYILRSDQDAAAQKTTGPTEPLVNTYPSLR